MTTKFSRYISKNIPENAIATINQKYPSIPKDYYGNLAQGNALTLYHGYCQRQNIEPRHYSPVLNKDRVGVNIRGGLGPQLKGEWGFLFSEHSANRKMRVFQSTTNHMQSTPRVRKGFWVMQVEPIGVTRSHAMLWGRCTEDSFYRWGDRDELKFASMQDAVTAAKQGGYEVDVIYPHERYHTQKAYADNFNFIKEAISDIEEDEFRHTHHQLRSARPLILRDGQLH